MMMKNDQEIDLTIECCMTCKHWSQSKGFDIAYGDCSETGDETNMHSGCDSYEAM